MRQPSSILIVLALLAVYLVGCAVPSGGRVIGGEPVSIDELPTYPGAVELKSGESKVIDPVFGPAQRETPPFIGLGIEVLKSERNFQVPPQTTFADVKAFYADKLQSAGWREDPAMRVYTSQVNESSPRLQGGIWVRVDQTLFIALATDPATGAKEVTLSLATH